MSTWLTGGLAFLTGVVGAFGVATGDIGRVARNHPVLFAVLLSIALLAVALGVVVAATNAISNVVLGVSVFALSLVTVWLTVLVATDESQKEGPAVTGGLTATKDQLSITGSAKVGGLKSGEHLVVDVRGRVAKTQKLVPIYRAIAGPDADGKVDSAISTVAAGGRYDAVILQGVVKDNVPVGYQLAPSVASCSTTVTFRGCAILMVPKAATKPGKTTRRSKNGRARRE